MAAKDGMSSALLTKEQVTLGDIGIYEFDACSDFPETLLNAVINILEETGEFAVKEFFIPLKLISTMAEVSLASLRAISTAIN